MRSQRSILDHRNDSGDDRRITRVRLAASSIIKKQLFSQDFYLGTGLVFLEAENWLADFRIGDFEGFGMEASFSNSDFSINENAQISLQFVSFKTQEEITRWYSETLKNRRLAAELTDDAGVVQCYNPYIAEAKVVNDNDGYNKVQLSFKRASHYPSDMMVNLDHFLPPVLQNSEVVPAVPESPRRFISTVECIIV